MHRRGLWYGINRLGKPLWERGHPVRSGPAARAPRTDALPEMSPENASGCEQERGEGRRKEENMVGIVIVSHSATLAESVRELAQHMIPEPVPIAIAGGIDDPEHPFGTDVNQVHQAIESVYSDEGVVVLMDLGSALLSAEMALEFLAPEQRARVRLCSAPLVEGAIAAAIQAGTGAPLEQVVSEAQEALSAKAVHLETAVPPAGYRQGVETRSTQEMPVIIRNRLGLHARPAARFVSIASRFQATITVRNVTRNTPPVNGKSISQIATLGVGQGHEIVITATGSDAEEALAALKSLIDNRFGEPEPALEALPSSALVNPPPQRSGEEFTGIPASPGIALGPAMLYHPPIPKVIERQVDDPPAEWQRLEGAVQVARQELQTLRTQTTTQMSPYEAMIFDAHLLLLEDPALLERVHQRIHEEQLNAEASWWKTVEEILTQYHDLDDPFLQARTADLVDVRDRVLRILSGEVLTPFALSQPAILLAPDLTPSDMIRLNTQQVLGIVTALGNATSHSAILARTLGVPAVFGLGPAILRIPEGTFLALDGEEGKVWVNPDQVDTLRQRWENWLVSQQTARQLGQQPACTRDGHHLPVMANIQGVTDVRSALEFGAEGVGLLRTEFLYLHRMSAPSEEEQLAIYQTIAETLGARPLTIRTLDAGGDKPLPYLTLPGEPNPFLGWRGIRLCLDHPALLKTQLRAIVRASPGHQIKIMFPLISTLEEVRRAKTLLAEVQIELSQEGIPLERSLEVGVMIEVPSAVVIADQLAKEVDFFSIGTNDLCQYVLAADRTNARVAGLTDALHPAVLRMIHHTVQAGHEAGIWVSVCGELTGDPLAIPLLLGSGVDALSMPPPAIPRIKETLSRVTVTEAKILLEEVLHFDSATAVRHYLTDWLSQRV